MDSHGKHVSSGEVASHPLQDVGGYQDPFLQNFLALAVSRREKGLGIYLPGQPD